MYTHTHTHIYIYIQIQYKINYNEILTSVQCPDLISAKIIDSEKRINNSISSIIPFITLCLIQLSPNLRIDTTYAKPIKWKIYNIVQKIFKY